MFFRHESCRVSRLFHRSTSVCIVATNVSMVTTQALFLTYVKDLGNVGPVEPLPTAKRRQSALCLWELLLSAVSELHADSGSVREREWTSRPPSALKTPPSVTKQRVFTTGNRAGDSVTADEKKGEHWWETGSLTVIKSREGGGEGPPLLWQAQQHQNIPIHNTPTWKQRNIYSLRNPNRP